MAYLRCRECGRMLGPSNYSKIGLRCGLNGCNGIFEFAGGHYVDVPRGAKLDLLCTKCSHICSSAVTGKKVYDRCPIKGCNGTLDRYYGG
jgi:hypothetical protein